MLTVNGYPESLSAEQVVPCADLSHPNVCTESGDYMRAGYYKLLITSLMPKEICRRCANAAAVCVPRPPSKHFGSGINALSICEDSETGCSPLKYILPRAALFTFK